MKKKIGDLWSRLLKDRAILIGTALDDPAAELAIAQLLFLQMESRRAPVTVYVNSPGGYVSSGLAIFDTLQTMKPPIRTVCTGAGHGMAALLVAAGSKGRRSCLPAATFQLTPLEGTPAPADDLERLRTRVAELLATATGQPSARVRADMDSHVCLDAPAALRYGLVDEVVDA